ncbi:hypothetical protein Cpir12675_004181 [Ceratocystis pirilliformis]|uniref:Kinesin-like protein n=1 Tax=Ceratocystis pirilliformis TaxID=259994 RepID=A0ABR3YZU0_9PEZI
MAGGNIKVVVRCRPFNRREIDRGAKCIVEMKGNQTVLTNYDTGTPNAKGAKDTVPKIFAFDKSYWSFNRDDPNYAGQSNLFDDLGQPLLDNAFQGYNNCIFAYGQTGSGKSYSMMGYGKEIGITPMICQDMFRRIAEMQQDSSWKCTVEVSYLEIYNERVRDLLNPSTKGNLKVREHPSTGPYVEDLAKLAVTSFAEIENLMDEGNKARTVAATNMNETSSRSHAVFTLMLTQKKYDAETKMAMEKVAKISLVDLAGSERANSTGATGARLKEGAEINRSLSTLGRVIAALADLSTGKKKKGAGGNAVPYRDSVLTWLLKDSLGGNSMTAMIAAISPADINYDETLSTLRYADSAKRIKNHAVVNEDANARMIRELKEELTLLRNKLGGGGGSGGPGSAVPPEEVYAEGTPLEKQFVTITTPDGSTKKVSKAEIAEQLTQSEKLLTDLNQTWEEKLQKTEEIQKEREAALEELGISIEKGFVGLTTPKKMPHLVNLSDDPLLAECLIYNLKPGTTTVGNVETNADQSVNIRLNGSRILHEHCVFDNAADGTVTVVPHEGASVMVNGKRISEPKQLHSGYRVILGDFHIFRFNHPTEAREERAQQSLLRQSITANQLVNMGSPSSAHRHGHGHERSFSRALSDMGSDSRPDSPKRDNDWSFARREAASAILGTDQNFASLTDEELNALFETVQRARTERVIVKEGEEDSESSTSYPMREKYMSTGTIDNFSLDTALTMPSTPKQGNGDSIDDKMQILREEMQQELDKQKEEFQTQLQTAEAAHVEVEEIKQEKVRMELALRQIKEDMQLQLAVQRAKFEDKIEKLDPLKRPKANPKLSEEEMQLAREAVKAWRGRHFVRMAEAVLQNAAILKEAQITANELMEGILFQFTVVGVGHTLCSSYDMVLNGLGDSDDSALYDAPKPCIGVRVMDHKHSVVHLWSLDKLHDRVRQMRQMYQYLDQPKYAQHLSLDNPFIEQCMPQYTLVGEVDVPLRAVFESRVQDFQLDVLSPYTSHAIGVIKLSLEPSHARAPTNTLKFNVVMQELVGFPEREGTEVHAQLFIPGVSEEDGISTTQMIRDFDELPIRFESVHSMSVPMFSPHSITLRVAIFAKVSSMHLDKLLSWDNMRDAVPSAKDRGARISESQFYTREKHDLLARLQILEMDENGSYVPVEVTQTSDGDVGTFQLHQGLQRRIGINVSHSSGDALPWEDVSSVKVGRIQILDAAGKTPDMSGATPFIPLRLSQKPIFKENVNGTRSIVIYTQWDSSLHNSLLLDRVTPDKYRVQMTVSWEIASSRLAEPMSFSIDLNCQVLSRTHVRQQSMLSALWSTMRIVRSSTGIFTLTMRPASIKRIGDLWRLNSTYDYVKGEESLTQWTPRGVSLVSDYILAQKRKQRSAEIEGAYNLLKRIGLPRTGKKDEGDDESLPTPDLNEFCDDDLLNDTPEPSQVDEEDRKETQAEALAGEADADAEAGDSGTAKDGQSDDRPHTNGNRAVEAQPKIPEKHRVLLERCIKLWLKYPDPLNKILSAKNTSPPSNGLTSEASEPPSLITTIVKAPRNPKVMKGGYLLVPNSESTRWIKRFVELRRPYLHIFSATGGDEIAIVSLRDARIDSQPGVLGLLQGDSRYDTAQDPNGGGSGVLSPGSSPGRVTSSYHRRTASGRVISSIWTGSGAGIVSNGNSSNGSAGDEGVQRLSERLQSAVFAIYGKNNTWLFAARSERDKMEWILRIDQSFSAAGSRGNGASGGTPGIVESGTETPSFAGSSYAPSDTGI